MFRTHARNTKNPKKFYHSEGPSFYSMTSYDKQINASVRDLTVNALVGELRTWSVEYLLQCEVKTLKNVFNKIYGTKGIKLKKRGVSVKCESKLCGLGFNLTYRKVLEKIHYVIKTKEMKSDPTFIEMKSDSRFVEILQVIKKLVNKENLIDFLKLVRFSKDFQVDKDSIINKLTKKSVFPNIKKFDDNDNETKKQIMEQFLVFTTQKLTNYHSFSSSENKFVDKIKDNVRMKKTQIRDAIMKRLTIVNAILFVLGLIAVWFLWLLALPIVAGYLLWEAVMPIDDHDIQRQLDAI